MLGAAWLASAGGLLAQDQPAAKRPASKTAASPKATANSKSASAKQAAAESAAKTEAEREAAQAAAKRDAAAIVNGVFINRHEVERAVERVVAGRELSPQELNRLHAEALAHRIDQQLVEQRVRADGVDVSEAELELAAKQAKLRVEQQQETWESFLGARRQTEEEYRSALAWRFLWERYCQREVKDKELEAYFNEHRAEFDGTQLRVSHVLLRAPSEDPAAKEKLLADAAQLRERIAGGELTFADAARERSAGPSSERGGELGLIGRVGPMVEPFTAAAFALKLGEVSPPVTTAFGVHLITVTEVLPGSKKWTDVRDQLAAPVAARLFTKIADDARKKAKIRFAPGVAHFRPGTRELE